MKVEAQNHIWSIVPKAITFGNTGNVSTNLLPLINPLQTSQYPSNAMEDVNGNILFSVVDGTVYSDANGGQWQDINYPNVSVQAQVLHLYSHFSRTIYWCFFSNYGFQSKQII